LKHFTFKIIQEKLENELHIFYNFFVILYANDTVILSETKEGMQQALDIFESYCEIWKLQRLNIIIHIINYFETFPFYFTIL
jgi:hypothetical protein